MEEDASIMPDIDIFKFSYRRLTMKRLVRSGNTSSWKIFWIDWGDEEVVLAVGQCLHASECAVLQQAPFVVVHLIQFCQSSVMAHSEIGDVWVVYHFSRTFFHSLTNRTMHHLTKSETYLYFIGLNRKLNTASKVITFRNRSQCRFAEELCIETRGYSLS